MPAPTSRELGSPLVDRRFNARAVESATAVATPPYSAADDANIKFL